MKKIILWSVFSLISISVFSQSKGKSNTFEIQAKGSANSTWLINENVSNYGDRENMAMAWGFNYGVAFNAYFGRVGFGIEALYGNHKGGYSGKIGTLNYTSNADLKLIQIPLLFKLKSEGGVYLEIGPQFTSVSSVTYTANASGYPTYVKDVTSKYASSYFSAVLGFGANIALGKDSPFGILVGLRLQYSFTDLKGVDAEGQDLNDKILYPTAKTNAAAAGGLVLGFVYKLNK